MTISFLSPIPLERVQALGAATRGLVAVPYIGKGGASLLPLLPGSALVTRLDVASVRQGVVDPAEVVKLIRRGVSVHSCANLHAKVYVFGRRAVIGSANLSKSSMGMVEAAVETTDPAAVRQAKEFVLAMCVDPVGEEYARSLVPLYPGERVAPHRRSPGATPTPLHSVLWVTSIRRDQDWSAEALRADRAGRPIAAKQVQGDGKARLEALEWVGTSWKRLGCGQRIVQRYAKGRGFEFDPPARIVHIEPFDGGAMVYLERPKRLRVVSSTAVRTRLKQGASALTFAGEGLRQIRSASTASAFSRIWPVLQSSSQPA